jgi:malonate transporter and related proteins
MLAILQIILPVFGLIGLGFAARAAGLVTDRAGDGLSDYIFTLAVPCLLFKTLATAVLPAVQPWGYWIAYFAGAGVAWALGMWAASRIAGLSGPAGVACGFAAAQSNTVLVGIPLILSAFGEAGAVPLALLLAIHLPITMTTATIMAEGRNTSALEIGRKLVTHPIIVGILLGSLMRPVAGQLPQPVWSVIDAVAATAVPCALITLGIALKRYGLEGGAALPAYLSGLKLILHPLIVFVLAAFVFDLPKAWAGVAVMFAACPCGINAYIFAERYRQGMAETSSAIALSTLLSLGTLIGWLWVLGAQP